MIEWLDKQKKIIEALKTNCPQIKCEFNYDGECIPNNSYTDNKCYYLKEEDRNVK